MLPKGMVFSAEKAVAMYKAGTKTTDIAVAMGYKRGQGQNRTRAALVKAGVLPERKGVLPRKRKARASSLAKLSPNRIRKLRVRAGLSQSELAHKVGVSQVLVSNWEKEKSVQNAEQDEKLKQILGLGVNEDAGQDASPIAAWVNRSRISKDISVPELADRSGLTPPAIYRIEAGITRNLRASTRQKLEKVLGKMPEGTAEEAAEDAAISGLGSLEDFDPHSEDERPSAPGIYVLYDISERPIYVGEGGNVKKRIQDHEEKFWFKRPIVETASWIKVDDNVLRKQIEAILIKFLKSNAVINKQLVDR